MRANSGDFDHRAFRHKTRGAGGCSKGFGDSATRRFADRAAAFADQEHHGVSAGVIVHAGYEGIATLNTMDETELAHIIATLGEERFARRVARAIVAARPLSRTGELADVVAKALGPQARRHAIHPATRTFQALRLYVNDELGELSRGLEAAERVLRTRGRLVVVAFHSLEDRIVKQFLARRSAAPAKGSRHLPEARASQKPTFRLVDHRAKTPDESELKSNPRARSAKLRVAERTAVSLAA
jgi:16S rRNA (cytosine1402-N4)-methyltransferase